MDPGRLFSMTRPCRSCPFLRTLPIELGRARRDEIAASIRRGEAFTCHRTIDYSDTDDDGTGNVNTDRARACAGAIGTLENGGEREQQLRQVARRLGFPVVEVDAGELLFSDLDEWRTA